MQYWVFFWGGVGGDGFSNLIEQAYNVQPADGVLKWRDIPASDDLVRFTVPLWIDNIKLFRDHNEEFDLEDITLNPIYVDLVEKGINTVIPVHPWKYYDIIDNLSYKNILTKDQHRIFLYSTNIKRIISEFNIKNNPDPKMMKETERSYRSRNMMGQDVYPPKSMYNTFIDIDRSWVDWPYLNNILTNIGIDLSKSAYDTYLRRAKRI
jgi:hypothetical protein